MAETFEGLTVKFSTDTQEFQAGLKGMNQAISLLKKEMQNLKTELRIDPKNIQIIDQQIQNFSEQLRISALKAEELQKKIASLSKEKLDSAEGKKWQLELEKVDLQMNQAQSNLDKLNQKKKDFEDPNSLYNLNKSIKQTSEELKIVEQKLKLEPSNVELTRQKFELLAKQIQQTEQKTEALRKEQSKLGEAAIGTDEWNKYTIEIGKAEVKTQALKNALNEMDNETKNANDGFTVLKGTLANLVATGIEKLASATVSLSKNAFQTGMEFESAFTGVKKTVSATESQFAEFERQIRNMAKEIPLTTSEISGIAEAAGQLGIENDNLMEFTRTMADLGVSTNMTSEEAATALSRLANITGMSQDKFSNLGATIVELGDNFATTESEITAMALNISAAGKQVGMSEADIAGVATALSSLGLEAQAGGTAISKLLINMANDCELGAGNLEYFAKAAKMTTSEFQKYFAEDATGALTTFITGLGNLEDESALAFLDEMKIKEVRLRDAILRTSNANDLFTRAITTGNKAWEENTALINEANKRYQTTESQIQIMKNKLSDVAITLFEKLTPAITKVIKAFSEWTDSIDWNGFFDTVSSCISRIVNIFKWFIDNRNIFISAISGMLAAFVFTKILDFSSAVKGMIDILKSAPTIMEGATKALKALNLTALANPWVALTATIGGVVAALVYFSNTSDETLDKMNKQAEASRKEKEAVLENEKAWQELNKTKQESINAGFSEMEHYESLYNELLSIVDANGKVKDGYENRARFITTTLSKALGQEISLTDGVIQNYDTLSQSIDELIEKKKAQIILESQEESYKKAITEKASLLQAQNELEKEILNQQMERAEIERKMEEERAQGLNDLTVGQLLNLNKQKEALDQSITDRQIQYATQENMLKEFNTTIGTYEKSQADFLAGNYEAISETTWQHVNDMDNAQKTEIQQLEEQIATEDKNLQYLKEQKEKYQNDIYDSQIKASEKRLRELSISLESQLSTVESGNEQVSRSWLDAIAQQLSIFSDSQVEFRDAGNGQVQMYVNGVQQGEPRAIDKMHTLASTSIEQINNEKGNAQKAGENLIDGVDQGVGNPSKQSSVFGTVARFAKSVLSTLSSNLQEQSPSKATEEMGINLLKGLTIGIDDEKRKVLKQTSEFGKNVLDSFEENLGQNLSLNIETTKAISGNIKSAYNVGLSIADGFLDGLDNFVFKVTQAIKGSLQNVGSLSFTNSSNYAMIKSKGVGLLPQLPETTGFSNQNLTITVNANNASGETIARAIESRIVRRLTR